MFRLSKKCLQQKTKQNKTDVLDFPGWVIKPICFFGVTVSFTSIVVYLKCNIL